ncbi:MAG: hypothetical protein M5U26_02735 [Planctomycetota bacterium]|nr:hypothetical protein [Planctomycetota bacterium]
MEKRPAGRFLLLPVSAAMDLYDSLQHFKLDPNHPDFPATGLKKVSYIIGNRPIEVSLAALETQIGCLQGNLALEFQDWFG